MNKNFIAITIGDINGIGLEILIDLYCKNKIKNFILFTNYKIFINKVKKKILKSEIHIIYKNNFYSFYNKKKFLIYTFDAKNQHENTYNSLIQSYNLTKNYNFKGIINLPLNKKNIIKNIDKNFIGQTEFYQKLDSKKISNMIFIYNQYIITTLTTHIPINKVSKQISSKSYIFDKIISLELCLKNNFNIKNPKILISGLNPHASENGCIGNEEEKIINPVINKLKKNKINIFGPYSSDSFFNKKNINKYDCFAFIYHDQALILYKYISKNRGVNFTGGLSILRVSPDHGTAYNIVGKNLAENKSLLNCFKFINSRK